jgi:hypothetical protein
VRTVGNWGGAENIPEIACYLACKQDIDYYIDFADYVHACFNLTNI